MSTKQQNENDTQKDTVRQSINITDDIYKRYWDRHANKKMDWDDTNRDTKEAKDDAEKGFLSEVILVDLFEKKFGPKSVEWKGEKGEADIKLFGEIDIEVKCRDTSTYRNLIIDEGKLDHSKVDIYINTVLHRDMLTEDPTTLEIIGHISKEESKRYRSLIEGGMYGYDDEEKYEVHPKHLNNFKTFLKTVELHKNTPTAKIRDIL